MEEITLSIDCYQCGTKLTPQVRLLPGHSDCWYCPDCQEGIRIFLDGEGILTIDRLEQE